MQNDQSVDKAIKERVWPQYQPIVAAFRQLMKEAAPQATEYVTNGTPAYPGNPAWRIKRIIVLISPTQKGITFAFSQGGKFQDKYGMLEGVGKASKNIRLSRLEDFDPAVMRYYAEQAVKLDEHNT